MGTCQFPGCRAIRGECIGILDKVVSSQNFAKSVSLTSLGMNTNSSLSRQRRGRGKAAMERPNHNPLNTSSSMSDSSNSIVNIPSDVSLSMTKDLGEEEECEPVTIVRADTKLYTCFKHLRGTGEHPLELVIKAFLSTSDIIQSTMLPVLPGAVEGVTPDLEIAQEEASDKDAMDVVVKKEYLAMKYKDLLAEGLHLRYIHRRILAVEKCQCLDPNAVLEAAGGILALWRMFYDYRSEYGCTGSTQLCQYEQW